jgi:hypothetical protein
MGQHHEREQLRAEQEKRQRAAQEQQIEKIVADTRKNYDQIKELMPDVNPKAWKALLFIRAKLRRIRTGWLQKTMDSKVSHIEKDILLGQYNAVLLAFDIIEQIRTVNKEMVPGKEAEYIREKLFRNPNVPQQAQR